MSPSKTTRDGPLLIRRICTEFSNLAGWLQDHTGQESMCMNLQRRGNCPPGVPVRSSLGRGKHDRPGPSSRFEYCQSRQAQEVLLASGTIWLDEVHECYLYYLQKDVCCLDAIIGVDLS